MRGLHVRSDTRTEFIKEETFGLVKTLGWEIAGSTTLPVESSTRMSFFGSGQIERIKVRCWQIHLDTLCLSFVKYIVYLLLNRGAERTLFVLYGPCWA